MTKQEFTQLIKNMGGNSLFAHKIGCSKRTVDYMISNGYVSNQYRGAVMLAAKKDGYKVKITDINKVMT